MSKDGEIGLLFLGSLMVGVQLLQFCTSRDVQEVKIVGDSRVQISNDQLKIQTEYPIDVKLKNDFLNPASIKIDNASSVRSDCSCHYGNGE